jgi:quercetin dioxygenase-like cupin family protein
MDDHTQSSEDSVRAIRVLAGEDRFGAYRGLGVSAVQFKLIVPDGSLFVIENTFHAKGGPARHLHHAQDEWFYALEGTFVLEVGAARYTLNPGDSVLAPRGVPHVWAFTGPASGRILIAFTPAGQMEGFFRVVTQSNAMAPQDPALWRAYGMELVGPPLSLDA